MTPFIILCAVMLVAAVAWVLLPLLRPVPSTVKGQPLLPPATLAAVTLALALPLAAAALYAGITSFPWRNPQAAAAAPPGHDGANNASMDEVTRQLEARLKDNPNDAEGWSMLGRTYLVTGRADKAAEAYAKALAIVGDKNPALRLDYAEALIVGKDPAAQDQAKKIVDAALAADENNLKALWYSGVLAYQAEDKETAKARWTKLLALNPPEEIRQILVTQLTALGAPVPPATAAGGAPTAAGPMMGAAAQDGAAPTAKGRTIRVAVSVDPALADKVKPGATLFVAARQPGIPGPPLAALRLTTDALPTTVVLSDANSMVEGRDLSSVDDVEVVARVAFGGTATTASGDLIGTAIQKKGGPADLKVSIAKVQP